jgi:hypothetical protein
MEILTLIFRFLHILGLALLIGGAAAKLVRAEGGFRALILGGAVAQVVTGLILFFLNLGDDVDHLKITVKLVVAVAIVVLLFPRKLQAKALGTWLVLALAVINTGLAVFW